MKEAAEKELQEFVQLLKSAKAMPLDAKPPKSSWITEEKTRDKIKSLESYAIDDCRNDDQKKTAGVVTYCALTDFVFVYFGVCTCCACMAISHMANGYYFYLETLTGSRISYFYFLTCMFIS